MSPAQRVVWDSFGVNILVSPDYLDDSLDGLPPAKADALEDIIETAKAAFVANLTTRVSAVLGPDIAITTTEH